jgi:hypothetical protein
MSADAWMTILLKQGELHLSVGIQSVGDGFQVLSL